MKQVKLASLEIGQSFSLTDGIEPWIKVVCLSGPFEEYLSRRMTTGDFVFIIETDSLAIGYINKDQDVWIECD